jgi:hypothetical protein
MLLLAHLLRTNWEWAGSEIRVRRVVEDEAGREPAADALRTLTAQARIEATTEVIVSERDFRDVLTTHSRDAACVFLGFELPPPDAQSEWHAGYNRLLEGMPTTVLISSQGGEDALA